MPFGSRYFGFAKWIVSGEHCGDGFGKSVGQNVVVQEYGIGFPESVFIPLAFSEFVVAGTFPLVVKNKILHLILIHPQIHVFIVILPK